MHIAAGVQSHFAQFCAVQSRLCLDGFLLSQCQLIQAFQEAVSAFYARIAPLQALFWRCSKHGEQTCCVGAILIDQGLWVDAIVFGLRHFLNTTNVHGCSTVAEFCRDRPTLVVKLNRHVGRVDPDFFAIGFFGVIGVVQHHALGEQGGGGLTEFHQAQVVHDLGPEAAVKQVQNGMFNTADVLVHGHPVIAAFVSHRVCVVTNITREIPAGIDEGVHGVCFTARGFTALGAFAFIECSAFGQWVSAAIGHQVFGQHHGQVGFRYGNIATGVAVNHGNGGAPVALA